MVVGSVAAAPAPGFLVHIEADAAVLVHPVVGGGLPFLLFEYLSKLFSGHLAGGAVDRNRVDCAGALGGLVGGKVGVDDERAVHWCLLVHSL